MKHRLGRVHVVRAVVLVSMGLGLLGVGSFLCRNLLNSQSDVGFVSLYVVVPIVLLVATALFITAYKIVSRKD